MVVNVLLNQIKSSLSKSNLGVPAINKSQILVVSDELVEKKLPSIYFPSQLIRGSGISIPFILYSISLYTSKYEWNQR